MVLFLYIFMFVFTFHLSFAYYPSAFQSSNFGSMDLFNDENMERAFAIQAPPQSLPTVSSMKDTEDELKNDASNVKAMSQRRMLYLPFLRTMRSVPHDKNDVQKNPSRQVAKPNQLKKVSYKYFIRQQPLLG
uniref:Uncharacterized protein n=1 Tax=Panagrolaimus sp. ES5 TaxID=591445 RepID=A0AC34FKZ4_9BILA